jgi:hypothetical protein
VPSAVALEGALTANIGLQLPSLEAQLAGAVAVQASVTVSPPTLAAQLDAALAVVAGLQASIALGLPGVALDVSAMVQIIAELEASIGKLQADLALAAGIGLQLGTPGVWLYAVEGRPEDIIPGGIPGVSADVAGVILLGTDAGAVAAIQSVFRTA